MEKYEDMKIEYACMYINYAIFIIKLKQNLEESLKWRKKTQQFKWHTVCMSCQIPLLSMVRRLTQNAQQVGISVNLHPRTIKIFVQNF